MQAIEIQRIITSVVSSKRKSPFFSVQQKIASEKKKE